MRVLITGGRHYRNKAKVWDTLDRICNPEPKPLPTNVTIIHGGATGADQLANDWAVHNYVTTLIYRADWQRHGKAAGPIRNQYMLEDSKPDLVVAFPGGKGTAHMVQIAKAAGVPVYDGDVGIADRWCVKHRGGWCAIKRNRKPAEGAASVPTLCGYHVFLPYGYEQREPTCSECNARNKIKIK